MTLKRAIMQKLSGTFDGDFSINSSEDLEWLMETISQSSSIGT